MTAKPRHRAPAPPARAPRATRRGPRPVALFGGFLLSATFVLTGALGGTSGSAAGLPGDPPPIPLLDGLLAPATPDDDPEPADLLPQPVPEWALELPADTTQVVRTTATDRWCEEIYCSVTEAWEQVDGAWQLAEADGKPAVFRSQIGAKGFAAEGKRRQGDLRTPSGVYDIATTFSTPKERPTDMPWRRRLPTSVVSSASGKTYNTWLEVKGNDYGDRRMMSWGFWIDYNNPRQAIGVGPKPVPGLGSGIFAHTSNPGRPWVATLGCVQIGQPHQMEWVVRWLDPEANPRVVNNV